MDGRRGESLPAAKHNLAVHHPLASFYDLTTGSYFGGKERHESLSSDLGYLWFVVDCVFLPEK